MLEAFLIILQCLGVSAACLMAWRSGAALAARATSRRNPFERVSVFMLLLVLPAAGYLLACFVAPILGSLPVAVGWFFLGYHWRRCKRAPVLWLLGEGDNGNAAEFSLSVAATREERSGA